VTDRVREACLAAKISGLNFNLVEIREPRRKTAKPKETATPLEMEMLALHFFEVTESLHLNEAFSGRTVVSRCSECGWTEYHIVPNAPIIITDTKDLVPDVFIVTEIGSVFCNERFRQLVIDLHFSNVMFKERGEIRRN